MGAVRTNLIFALAIGGGIAGSQLPEFAQQYRQRIGGAIEELGRVIAEFDSDAARNGLTREQAIERHSVSGEGLFRSRGESMSASIERFDTLTRQRADFESTPPAWQPVVLMRSDDGILSGTWADFRPAVPVTLAGAIWAALGFFTFAGLFALLAMGWRRGWRAVRMLRAKPVEGGA